MSSTLSSSSSRSHNARSRINIVVVGSGEVGKSTLCVQYVRSVFVDSYDPTIMDSLMKVDTVSGQTVALTIADTAGQDDYVTLRASYLRAADAILFVYSVQDSASLQAIPTFCDQALQSRRGGQSTSFSHEPSSPLTSSSSSAAACRVPFMVIGNKTDLPHRTVSEEQGRRMALHIAHRMGLSASERSAFERRPPHLETTATEHSDAAQAFQSLAAMVLRYRQDQVLSYAPVQSQQQGVHSRSLSKLDPDSPTSASRQSFRDVPTDDTSDDDAVTVQSLGHPSSQQQPPHQSSSSSHRGELVVDIGPDDLPPMSHSAEFQNGAAERSLASLNDLLPPSSAPTSPSVATNNDEANGKKKKKKKKKSTCVLV